MGLAARQRVGHPPSQLGEVHGVQRVRDAARYFLPLDAAHLQREREVLADAHVGEEQRPLLEKHELPVSGRSAGDRLTVDPHRPGGHRPGARDCPEQRALPRTRSTHEHEPLAGLHRQVDSGQPGAVAERHVQALQLQDGPRRASALHRHATTTSASRTAHPATAMSSNGGSVRRIAPVAASTSWPACTHDSTSMASVRTCPCPIRRVSGT